MDVKRQDNIFYAFLTLLGVAVYAFCSYLSYALMRIGWMCASRGGIYTIGIVLFVLAFAIPMLYSVYFGNVYMKKRKGNKVAMFILCALLVLLFMLYCLFVNTRLINGRDVTLDFFLSLELLIVPIVYAVKAGKMS